MDLQRRIRQFLADFDAIQEWEGNDQLCEYLSDAVAMLREVERTFPVRTYRSGIRRRREAATKTRLGDLPDLIA